MTRRGSSAPPSSIYKDHLGHLFSVSVRCPYFVHSYFVHTAAMFVCLPAFRRSIARCCNQRWDGTLLPGPSYKAWVPNGMGKVSHSLLRNSTQRTRYLHFLPSHAAAELQDSHVWYHGLGRDPTLRIRVGRASMGVPRSRLPVNCQRCAWLRRANPEAGTGGEGGGLMVPRDAC